MYQGIVTMSPEWGECTGLNYQTRVQSWGEHLLEQSYPACVMLAIADNNYHRFVSGLEDANWSIFDSIMVWNYPQPERVVIARTPRQGLTYAQCLEQFGTGSLNIDETRIAVNPDDPNHRKNPGELENTFAHKHKSGLHINNPKRPATLTKGRWSANTILVHHPNCSDDKCVMDCHVHIMGVQSGQMKSTKSIISDNRSQEYYGLGNGGHSGTHTPLNSHNDTGTASRFFYQGRSRQDVMDYLVTLIRPPTENPTLLIQTERIASL